MRCLILLSLWSLYGNCYGKTAAKLSEKACRCEGNGRCELEPRLSKVKTKTSTPVNVTRTNERAYRLIEKTRLIKEKVNITYTQGGCDHSFRNIAFVTPSPHALSDYKSHLSTVLGVVVAIEEKDLSQAIKVIIDGLQPHRAAESSQNNFCRELSSDKVTCFTSVEPNFSWVEIVFERMKDQMAYEVTYNEAL